MVKSNYIQKALNFLNAEMDLLKLKIQYPESFPKTAESAFKFNLYITPKAKGLGIIGIAELVVSIFLSKEVKDRNGRGCFLRSSGRFKTVAANCPSAYRQV